MDVLVLGGTQWVGRQVSAAALARGHQVTCLARGKSGAVAEGATLVRADRSSADAYDEVRGRTWDAVVEVSWQPGFVRAALQAIDARHWTYVSSGNVYASQAIPGADESAPLMEPTDLETVTREQYGTAKRSCEDASLERYGSRLLIARAGLIGGPGDHTGRSGAWVGRLARAPHAPVLVPDEPAMATQTIDVRDLAGFLVDNAENGTVGVFNTVGPVQSFRDWFATCREVAGHDGVVIAVPSPWLLEQGVAEYMGPGSLAQWLVDEDAAGWSRRSGAAAERAGLVHRPRVEMVGDLLAYEQQMGFTVRNAGLTQQREDELLARWLDPS